MKFIVAAITMLALVGCGKAPDGSGTQTESVRTMDVEEPPPAAAAQRAAGRPASDTPGAIAVAVPQMAYSYKYAFRLSGDAIGRVQTAHVALCDRLGPARCQVLTLSSGGGEGLASNATLKLRVASGIARAFGRQLQSAATEAGGRAVSSSIIGEDVSKDIVDTEARLRQRTLLVERLTEILRTRTGKVSELVEAERSVAAAQEEIDQAKGWLAELRGRVAMATVEIDYQAVASDAAPQRSALGDAVAQSMTTFVSGIGTLIALLIFLLPWGIVAGLGWLGWRSWKRRRSARTPGEPTPPS